MTTAAGSDRYEVEQKFRLSDADRLARELARLGWRAATAIEQVDTYFAHPARDFSQTDEALRLRQVDQQNVLTYKGPKIDQTTKTREEIELPIGAGGKNAVQLRHLLQALGFREVAQVKKHRQAGDVAWEDRAIEVSIDKVEEVGLFVELELVADRSQVEFAKQTLQSLASHLQLRDSERRSYLELLLEVRSAGQHRPSDVGEA